MQKRGIKMARLDGTVKKECLITALWVLILSVPMQILYLLCGFWSVGALLGNLYGGAVAVLNFFLLGLTVQNALGREEKEAKSLVKLSLSGRMLLLLGAGALGIALPCFDSLAVVIPFVFPRISVYFRAYHEKKKNAKNGNESGGE